MKEEGLGETAGRCEVNEPVSLPQSPSQPVANSQVLFIAPLIELSSQACGEIWVLYESIHYGRIKV